MRREHRAIIIVGLGFGDCGKGSLTDALVRRHDAGLVVRYNGGAQAAHAVVLADGRSHIFHQFGSGTFVPGVATFLSRHMLVNPLTLFWEEQELQAAGVGDAFERLFIAGDALVTTPFQMAANRLREYARGDARHGSCGLGIGETVADALEADPDDTLRVGDLRDAATLRRKMLRHRAHKQRQMDGLIQRLSGTPDPLPSPIAEAISDLQDSSELEATLEVFAHIAAQVRTVEGDAFLAARARAPGTTIFEGAQGVLLDQDWGFHPHTTWSNATPENALGLLEEAGFGGQTIVLGALRAYHTRHGTGPFPTEDAALTLALPDPHNPANAWQGPFRAGWFDLPLARYALEAAGRVDSLALTCLDRLPQIGKAKIATAYRRNGSPFSPTLGQREHLEHREAMGAALRSVEVEYCDAPLSAEPYAARIAEALRLPLAVTSWGPTAADKRIALS